MKNKPFTQHVFILGAKGLGNYGGYETFVDKLTEYHQNDSQIKYHVACKLNGNGYMDESKLKNVKIIDQTHFLYHNADCFKIRVPKIGSAQAIFYDIDALKTSIKYCKINKIKQPIFYILACRIGPFIGKYVKQIHKINGKLYVNPDGHEWMRAKWSKPVRKYWKESERLMVKHADLLVCDSVNIEKYIHTEYKKYHPKTTFIAYGADIKKSNLADNDPRFANWLHKNDLKPFKYYLIVGRFVPENNFETMIREFMKSHSQKSLAIITTRNNNYFNELNKKLHFDKDSRIKFVGTVYDQELLKKIRENAYGYIHGHSVGGTNPSLLEALSATQLNLLYDVGFNEEVAKNAALYWTKENGNLSTLIDKADKLQMNKIKKFKQLSVRRIKNAYSWHSVSKKYELLWLGAKYDG